MISLRLAVPAILAAAGVAACLTYFVAPPPVEADQRLPPTMPNVGGPGTTASTNFRRKSKLSSLVPLELPLSPMGSLRSGLDQRQIAEEKAAAAYLEAAEAILRRAPNARASASNDERPIMGRIPLPKMRPITRP
jgi:hypothetical protein